MTALFTPLMFRAEDGEILFLGSPISDEAARVVRDVLRTAALDLTKTAEAADVLWSMCGQVRSAMSDATQHRIDAAETRRVTTIAPPSAA